MRLDAAESWPSQELIDSWLGQFHFEVDDQPVPVPEDASHSEPFQCISFRARPIRFIS